MSSEKLMAKTLYLQLYDSLPDEAKRAMSDLFETGIDDSGVWVRFGNVEATVGKIVFAMQKEKVDVVNVVNCINCRYGWSFFDDTLPGGPYVLCGKPYAAPRETHKFNYFCADGKKKEVKDND